MRRVLLGLGILAMGGVTLAGCGSTPLMERTLPDETRVVDGPTLAVPPDFALRPPRDAKDYDAGLRAQSNADVQGLVTGVSASAVTAGSLAAQEQAAAAAAAPRDAWLVEKAGPAQGDIRTQLEQDAKAPVKKKDKGLLDRWFGGSDDE